jgi:hypothetical protein
MRQGSFSTVPTGHVLDDHIEAGVQAASSALSEINASCRILAAPDHPA